MPATKPGATSLAAQAQERRGRHGTSPSIRSSPWIQSIGYRAPESGPVENGANWSRTASPAERKTRRAALPKPHRLRRGLDTCVLAARAHERKTRISSSPNSTPARTPSARPPRLTSSTGSPPRTWRELSSGRPGLTGVGRHTCGPCRHTSRVSSSPSVPQPANTRMRPGLTLRAGAKFRGGVSNSINRINRDGESFSGCFR